MIVVLDRLEPKSKSVIFTLICEISVVSDLNLFFLVLVCFCFLFFFSFHAKLDCAFSVCVCVCMGDADLLYSSGAGEVEAVLLLGLPMTDDQQIVLV